MAVSIGATTLYSSFGASATTATVIAAPGRLYGIVAATTTAAKYLQLYDTTSATTPVWMQFLIPAGDQIGVILRLLGFIDGAQFANGLTFGISTTSGSYVAATGSQTDVQFWYRKIGR